MLILSYAMSGSNILSLPATCKIEGCECYHQEIPLQILYWLSHRGIDIRPLFQKPYYHEKKKKQEKRFSDSVIKSNTVLSNEQNIAQHIPITESDNTNEQISFTLPSNVEKTNVCNSNRNVLDDFLTWTVVPNNQTESNNNNNDNTTANVRRSVPYKVPTTRRNI